MRWRCPTLVVLLSAVLATLAGYSVLPMAAQAAPAATVKVSLNPATIVADGVSKTVATATITGATGPQSVSFSSSDPGQKIAAIPGTTTATITSSTTVGGSTITATDTTAKVSGSATLIQTVGPASKITVTLTPSSIVADGYSKTVAVATVTDAQGHPVTGQAVSFSSSDAGQKITATPGTYSATITSSTTIGHPTITATDTTAKISSSATLAQTAATGAHIVLSLAPSTIVADGQSKTTASATVVDADGYPFSGDIVVFSVSDIGVRISPVTRSNAAYSATLTSSTTAGGVAVAATDLNTGVSTGAVLTQVHGPTSHVTVVLSPPVLVANGISKSTATISVADAHGNAVTGDSIKVATSAARVHVGPVLAGGSGLYTAVLTSSNIPRTVTITATDASESPAISGNATLTEVPAPSLVTVAKLRWSFYYTPSYTLVRALALQGSLRGSMIHVHCHGGGCPFAARQIALGASQHCVMKGKKQSCSASASYDVGRVFSGHRLKAGALVVVDVSRTGWIGKYYSFKIRSGQGPQVRINCLPPGGGTPGVGCSAPAG